MTETRFKKISIIAILMILIINLIPLTIVRISATSNPPTYRNNGWWNNSAGDWEIDTTGNIWVNKNISIKNSIIIKNGGKLTFQNCTVILNKNIIVNNNATLNLVNTTIKFNSTSNGSSELQVYPGGSLYIQDYDLNSSTVLDSSNITSNITDNKHKFIFYIHEKANFSMVNSEIHYCGYLAFQPDHYGPYIRASNVVIENNTFSNNHAGLIIESSNNTIRNNKIYNNEKYGCLIAFCRNNTLDNNSIDNNIFNFGLLLDEVNQSNNITIQNKINGNPIYYFERAYNQDINSTKSAGFIAVINSTNVTITEQNLINNYEGILLLGSNNSEIQTTVLANNTYGAVLSKTKNIIFRNCTISNNSDIGINLMESQLIIINSTINKSEVHDFQLNDGSDVHAINCTFNTTKVQVMDVNSKFKASVFLHIQTKNHNEVSIGNVLVNIYDGNNNLVTNRTTNTSGATSWIPCTSYEIIKSGIVTSMRTHRLHASYEGLEFNQYVTMNETRNVTFYLNHPPNITNEPPKLIYHNEESFFYYDFNFSDLDLDDVTWKIKTNAKWLNPIGKNSGIINGTPTNPDVGWFYLNISCDDGHSAFDYYNFSVVVNNTNDLPEMTSTQDIDDAYEDVLFSHDFNVYDPDKGDSHTWAMVTNANWLNPINKFLGTIYGTPLQQEIGKYFVNVTVMDKEGASDSFNFTLTVHPTNDQPVIINPENETVLIDEDSTYYYDFDYFDEDSDQVEWYLKTNATTWLLPIDSVTGEISGTPHDNDTGFFFINVSCKDTNNSIAHQNYTVLVRNTNDPPKFIDNGRLFYVNEDEYFESSFKIFDPDKIDMFEFTISTEFLNDTDITPSRGITRLRSSWLLLTASTNTRECIISGTPKNDDVGTLLINLTCSDFIGLSDYVNLKIIVNNTNDAPIITNREDNYVYALEDQLYYHDFDFIDVDNDSVTWSTNTNAYWLLDIDTKTGELSGIPTQDDLGVYFIEIFCRDPFKGWDSQNYTLQVNNTNDPPIISNPCNKIIYVFEEEFFEYDFNSIDFDSTTIYWSSTTNADWLNKINRFTGIINGTPGNDDIGRYFANVTCFDDYADSVYWNFTIIVNNTNDPPKIVNGYRALRSVNINHQYYFKFSYVDIDDDDVTWKISTNASLWLVFDAEEAVLSGIPTRLDIGSYYVNISCEDPYGGLGYYEYTIRVRGVKNHPPELFDGYVTPRKGDTETTFTFFVTYRDLDSDDPSVVVVKIDDTPYFMEALRGDDVFIGVVYEYKTKLTEGHHNFYFQAMDELDARAIIIDNSTPMDRNPGSIEVKKTADIGVLQAVNDNMLYILIFLIIIIVITGVIMQNRKARKKRAKEAEVDEKSAQVEIPEVEEILTVEEVPSSIEEGEPEPVEEEPSVEEDFEKEFEPEIGLELEPGIEEQLEKALDKKIEDFESTLDEDSEHGRELMICPQCGEFVDETYDSCPGCGINFVFETPSDDEDETMEHPEDLPSDDVESENAGDKEDAETDESSEIDDEESTD